MTAHEFALSDLAARLAGTDASLSTALRDILSTALQELIEAELTTVIGAAPGEHTAERLALRNGHRPKLVSTPAGDVEVGIPKLRTGQLLPGVARAAPADRQGLVGGDHDRVHHRHLDPEGRRPGQGARL